ncbi:MAG: amidohydrolase family protein [Actinomycetota bacterium]
MSAVASDRYAVISSDGHAGADLYDYRPYLASAWHDDFDAWAPTYENPFADLQAPTAYRSWDSDRRLEETEADGVVGEIVFPNTVPPFFRSSVLICGNPRPEDYEHRLAGIRAHNRWLVDFCNEAPGRRAGVFQVFVNRIEDAVAEVRWAKEHMPLNAGVLLPSVPPNCGLPGFWEPHYEPLWEVCAELDVPIQVHGGGGLPDYGDHDAARGMMLIELPWFAHRPVWHLIFGGVLERHPELKVVLTEQGVAWLPRGLETLDWFYRRMTLPEAAESVYFGAVAAGMSMTPSEYFERNFWIGASFLRPSESPLRHDVGVDKLMWGADYPHTEGSYGYTTEALRAAFGGVPEDEARAMIETNGADFFGFDLEALRPLADRIGPTVAEVAEPLDPADYPSGATCNAFDTAQVLRAW